MNTFFENIIAWDKEWFCRLGIAHTEFLDGFMTRFTSTAVWLPFFALITFVVWKNTGNEECKTKNEEFKSGVCKFFILHSSFFIIILALLLVVLLADQISYSVFKPVFERLRPSHNPAMAACVQLVNGYRGGDFGFVSNHAANTMGVALFTSLMFRYTPYNVCVFAWALMNCYTRIYLGVHYPLDLIAGAMVGFLVAGAVYFVWKKITQTKRHKLQTCASLHFEKKDLLLLSASIVLTTVVIAVI